MSELRNNPTSHDRAPSHRKPAVPRASEIAARLAAGETLAAIAADCGRTVGTLRQHLNERGYDSATGLPAAPEGAPSGVEPSGGRHSYGWALRYKKGSLLARRFPGIGRGRFHDLAHAEAIRDACPNAAHIEVVWFGARGVEVEG